MARERGGGGHWCIEYLHGCACEPMVLQSELRIRLHAISLEGTRFGDRRGRTRDETTARAIQSIQSPQCNQHNHRNTLNTIAADIGICSREASGAHDCSGRGGRTLVTTGARPPYPFRVPLYCLCRHLHISEALSSPLPSNAKESSPTGPRGPSHAPPGRRQGAVVCASQLLCNACLRSSRPAGSL